MEREAKRARQGWAAALGLSIAVHAGLVAFTRVYPASAMPASEPARPSEPPRPDLWAGSSLDLLPIDTSEGQQAASSPAPEQPAQTGQAAAVEADRGASDSMGKQTAPPAPEAPAPPAPPALPARPAPRPQAVEPSRAEDDPEAARKAEEKRAEAAKRAEEARARRAELAARRRAADEAKKQADEAKKQADEAKKVADALAGGEGERAKAKAGEPTRSEGERARAKAGGLSGVQAPSASSSAGSSGGAAFGAAGPAQVRDLGASFTRAVGPSGMVDRGWAALPAGDGGSLDVALIVSEEGKITGFEPLGDRPSEQLVKLVRQCLAMLRGGFFAIKGPSASGGRQVLRLKARLSDVDPSSVEGGRVDSGHEFHAGQGKATFTLLGGRHVEVTVQVLRVEAAKAGP